MMAKDKRPWRKLVKKLRRSKIRRAKALSLCRNLTTTEELGYNLADSDSQGLDSNERSRVTKEDCLLCDEDEILQHSLEEAAWLERERQSQLAFQMNCAENEKREISRMENEKRIRSEWEEKQRIEKEKRDTEERLEIEMKQKQEKEFDQFLSFLSGDIENPPLPYLMPEGTETPPCLYFNRTGACRFGDRCKAPHSKPTLSNTILIPNFFSHYSLNQNLKNFETDLSLEYEDSEMERDFLEFYEDVLPEFRLCGKVIQFKVSRNFEPHLSGNVYVQYETIRESVEAYRKFNGRYYNGKQLSLQFVKIESWNTAICGSFKRNRCQKGRSCNYIHVFRNPTTEFVQADRDFVQVVGGTKCMADQNHRPKSRERDRSRRRKRSRSRSRESSKHSKRKRSTSHRSKISKKSSRHKSSNTKKTKKKKHKKDKKSSKKSKHGDREEEEEADETLSDGSIVVNTPSPDRRK